MKKLIATMRKHTAAEKKAIQKREREHSKALYKYIAKHIETMLNSSVSVDYIATWIKLLRYCCYDISMIENCDRILRTRKFYVIETDVSESKNYEIILSHINSKHS